MERNGQREAIRLLSGASRASEDDNDHEKPLRQEEGYTSARSSGAYSVADFDSASPSSQAYPSHRVKSALARFSLYIGGSVRRRTVLGLASLVLVSLLFWGFGVHTMLLEEKEKFASSTHTNGQVATAPAATTPATPAGLSGLWDTDLVNDDPAVPAQSAVPAVTFDEHGHNRKPSNESEVCTTWPVDILGRYEAKTIAANQRHKLASHAPAGGWKKPAGLKIVAMIFFGRKRNVDILDCYLRQNLASNGGYLDEVHFMVKTTKEDDIEWLQEFVKTVDEYKFQGLDLCTTANGYGCIWEYANEDDTLYIKIDDDILYIHHDAIPQLVHTRLAVPQPFAVSAQLVNSPVSGLQQYHSGAIHPFIPDPYNYTTRHMGEEWRPSKWGVVAKDMKVATEGVKMDVESPYDGHPWVLMSSSLDDMSTLLKTPIGDWQTHRGDDPAFGPGWKRWAIAAQQEYSLLYNIELNEMDRYHFGRPMRYKTAPPFPIATMTPSEADLLETSSSPPSATGKAMRAPRGQGHQQHSGTINNTHPDVGGENLFDMQYLRYNLNFVAVWGRDVKLGLPVNTDDEADFTQFIPQRLGRPFVIDTRAVVAHNSFFTQLGGIQQTDLLDRWRALANEMACKPDNLKVPWDFRCSGF